MKVIPLRPRSTEVARDGSGQGCIDDRGVQTDTVIQRLLALLVARRLIQDGQHTADQ